MAEVGVVAERARCRLALLLEALNLRAAVRDHLPIRELLVDELRGWIVRVSLSDHLGELLLVARLRQGDGIGAAVAEVQPDDVQLLAERGLDVVVPVEAALLPQILLDRVDRLLLVGKAARQVVDGLPLRRARIRIDLDEDRRR